MRARIIKIDPKTNFLSNVTEQPQQHIICPIRESMICQKTCSGFRIIETGDFDEAVCLWMPKGQSLGIIKNERIKQ